MRTRRSSTQKHILRMRFGIGMDNDHTLEEVGQQFSMTARAHPADRRQALRKLKHPDHSRVLRRDRLVHNALARAQERKPFEKQSPRRRARHQLKVLKRCSPRKSRSWTVSADRKEIASYFASERDRSHGTIRLLLLPDDRLARASTAGERRADGICG
jgi:hypothetical protein